METAAKTLLERKRILTSETSVFIHYFYFNKIELEVYLLIMETIKYGEILLIFTIYPIFYLKYDILILIIIIQIKY